MPCTKSNFSSLRASRRRRGLRWIGASNGPWSVGWLVFAIKPLSLRKKPVEDKLFCWWACFPWCFLQGYVGRLVLGGSLAVWRWCFKAFVLTSQRYCKGNWPLSLYLSKEKMAGGCVDSAFPLRCLIKSPAFPTLCCWLFFCVDPIQLHLSKEDKSEVSSTPSTSEHLQHPTKPSKPQTHDLTLGAWNPRRSHPTTGSPWSMIRPRPDGSCTWARLPQYIQILQIKRKTAFAQRRTRRTWSGFDPNTLASALPWYKACSKMASDSFWDR